ncbi:unnamed protein product [Cyclocybe aegerita]|uniref:Uncharacterized protein n=1 Tax=Cyclocybe aegerita TaxID=1973307 RepID=A0A8S0WIT0_CYCAE|nr:unnamed protein product [Cyclocybe aegerita]
MARQGPRLHRLPHRTDYILIPAPLDLSLPEMTEKSPLPAIIVTPSSPSSSRDFSIAFLAEPPKPTLRERVQAYKHFNSPNLSLTFPSIPQPFNPSMRTRSILIILLIIFVLVCHLVTHRLAARRPHLEFSVQTGATSGQVGEPAMSWFDFRSLFGAAAEVRAHPPLETFHTELVVDKLPGAR